MEERKAKTKLSAFWKLFYPSYEHHLNLLQQLTAIMIHSVYFPFFLLDYQWALSIIAYLFVLFNIADQEHGTVFVFFAAADELQDFRNMLV